MAFKRSGVQLSSPPLIRKTYKSKRFTLTRVSSRCDSDQREVWNLSTLRYGDRNVGSRRNPTPSYLQHSQSGRARAVWTDDTGARRDRLLPGAFGSKESRSAFGKLVAELAAAPAAQEQTTEGDRTLADVLLAYLLHADGHYRGGDGKPTSEIYEVKIVVRAFRELYADLPVKDFGPLNVKAARQQWVTNGNSRSECNRRLGVVKRILKWAVSEQLVKVEVYQAIATIAGLQRGRTEAREVRPVGPVDDAVVDATLPFLNRHVRGLVELQRLTGCRPGEACSIRRSEIDTGGGVWLYRPPHHKNSWRGKARAIAIGPRAQALLREFFTPDVGDYLFSPRRAALEMYGLKARRRPKERYDRTTYTRAVARACEKLHPLPARLAPKKGEEHNDWRKRLTTSEKAEVRAWREAHRWAPNQLRHSHATKVRKAFGLEHAGATLGHSRMSATEVYAERDAGLAVEVAARLG